MQEYNQLDHFPKVCGTVVVKKHLKLKQANKTCEIDSYLPTYVTFPTKAKMNINGFKPCIEPTKNIQHINSFISIKNKLLTAL